MGFFSRLLDRLLKDEGGRRKAEDGGRRHPSSLGPQPSRVAKSSFYALPWQVGRALGPRTTLGYTLGDLSRHYSGWVYAAVRAIAQGCSSCELRFKSEEGRSKISNPRSSVFILPPSHPLRRLFSEVNPFHTYRELIEVTMTDLELTGNAFWIMMRGKLTGVPVEIWPLPPAWMRVVPGGGAGTEGGEFVQEYRLRRSHAEVRLDARDVVHFRYPNPEDPWWGRSPLEAAIEAVQADESIARAQRRSFENGPFPGALLRTRDPLTKEQQERFRALFESRHVGPDAAGRLLMTDGEAEITPFTTSPREMDFVDSARSVRDRILGVFGVPPAVLGIVEDFNRANAQAAQEIFARETLVPKLALIASRITQDVAPAFLPGGITCEFDSPVPADREANRRDMEAGVRLGILSANEARADFYGKAPLEGERYDRPEPVAGAQVEIRQE